MGNNTWDRLGPHWPIQTYDVTKWHHWDSSTYDYYRIYGSGNEHVRRRTSNDQWEVFWNGGWLEVS